MAYGKDAGGTDGNRGIQAGSPGPAEGAHMPDGWLLSVGTLTGNPGRLGENPGDPTSRQDIPGSREISPREQYNFQSPGEAGFLGQDTDDYGPDARAIGDDPQRPNVPSPEVPGESGTANMGPQGDTIDWNSVAPYEYPEFPQADSSSEVHISESAVPLT